MKSGLGSRATSSRASRMPGAVMSSRRGSRRRRSDRESSMLGPSRPRLGATFERGSRRASARSGREPRASSGCRRRTRRCRSLVRSSAAGTRRSAADGDRSRVRGCARQPHDLAGAVHSQRNPSVRAVAISLLRSVPLRPGNRRGRCCRTHETSTQLLAHTSSPFSVNPPSSPLLHPPCLSSPSRLVSSLLGR